MNNLNVSEVVQAEMGPRPTMLGDLNGPEEIGPQPKQWKQPRNELLREWEINIKFFNVGCVVSVGCQSFAFESIDKMMTELQFYVEHPDEARQKWNKIREEQE
jgi:hypothetical protein